MRKPILKLAVFACGLFLAHRASASIIATSYNNSPCSTPTTCSYEGGPVYPTLSQQITLTATDTITSIDAALEYSIDDGFFPATDLVMTIVNDASNTPGNTVDATDSLVTGTLTEFPLNESYADINFAFTPTTLGPGTYWVVIQLGSSFQTGHLFDWEYNFPTSTPPPGPGGVVDNLSYFGSSVSDTNYMAQINSSPEPFSLLTSLSGLAVVYAIFRRRNSQVN